MSNGKKNEYDNNTGVEKYNEITSAAYIKAKHYVNTEQEIEVKETLKNYIKKRSLTPRDGSTDDDGAAQFMVDYIYDIGKKYNIDVKAEIVEFEGVQNVYACIGSGENNLSFAGHHDVVDPGNLENWIHNPFGGVEEEGVIYGRGAVDMKIGTVAFVAAVSRLVQKRIFKNGDGKIHILVTGDEEDMSLHGMRPMLDWVQAQKIDLGFVIIGEATSVNYVGDIIKIGRRGSVNFTLDFYGTAGHAAYQENTNNPIGISGYVAHMLSGYELDEGVFDNGKIVFQPSKIAVVYISTDNIKGITNVTPGSAQIKFNVRFNTNYTAETMIARIATLIEKAMREEGGTITHSLKYVVSGEPFDTPVNNKGVQSMRKGVQSIVGKEPIMGSSGGTSDGRFISKWFCTVEFGVRSDLAHQDNEQVKSKEVVIVTAINEVCIENFLGIDGHRV